MMLNDSMSTLLSVPASVELQELGLLEGSGLIVMVMERKGGGAGGY